MAFRVSILNTLQKRRCKAVRTIFGALLPETMHGFSIQHGCPSTFEQRKFNALVVYNNKEAP
jgi:hypothetical protein